MLISFGLTSNQAFAGSIICDDGWIYDLIVDDCILIVHQSVGGLAVPVSESEVYGELAKQYSLWLIPTLSAVGIGAYIIKRKF